MDAAMRPSYDVDLMFDGYSPSLHVVQLLHGMRLRSAVGRSGQAQLAAQLDALMQVQTARADAARRLGFDKPIPLDQQEYGGTYTGHLLIDRATLAMLPAHVAEQSGWTRLTPGQLRDIERDPDQAVRRRIAEDVADLHRQEEVCGLQTTIGNGTSHVTAKTDQTNPASTRRIFGMAIDLAPIPTAGSPNQDHLPIVFDESRLSITGRTIPQTLAVSLVGRPLRNLAAVHPAIDHRIITAVHVPEGKPVEQRALVVELEPDLVPVDPDRHLP